MIILHLKTAARHALVHSSTESHVLIIHHVQDSGQNGSAGSGATVILVCKHASGFVKPVQIVMDHLRWTENAA